MDQKHWLLVILWLGYCFLHSFLASDFVKNPMKKFMGSGFKYYRPLYAIFAALSLGAILWFQYSFESPRLYTGVYVIWLGGLLVSIAGGSIMALCINKYFYELSGLQAIRHPGVQNTLQQSGLHRYVRHPLYLGTLLFTWGLFLIFPYLNNLLAASALTIYVWFGIVLEERKLHLEYGQSYNEYAKKVPKLIPHIFPIKKGSV